MSSSKVTGNYYKVIIIGAGAAGLSAANYLRTNGIQDVIILEANDRIGGRVHTVPFGSVDYSRFVELGANWIHGGSISNPVYTRAVTHNFFDEDGKVPIWNRFDGDNVFLTRNGKILDATLCAKVVKVFFEEEEDVRHIKRFEKDDADGFPVRESLITTLTRRLKDRISECNFSAEETLIAEYVINAMFSYLRFHIGDELSRVSTLLYGTYKDMPGGDRVVTHGYQNLLQTLADELSINPIMFNHVVNRIRWKTSYNNQLVTITCQNDTEWTADHVIVTSSLGFLKRNHRTVFEPSLPHAKVKAIENLGYGCTNKIFLEFEKPFWTRGSGNIILTWNDDELETCKKNELTSWQQSIFSFNEVYENPHVLVVWLAGDGAQYMESLQDKVVADTCLEVLKRFTANKTIPRILRIVRSSWKSDRFAQGSYTYCSTETGVEDITNLSLPLMLRQKPIVLFAGEATHPRYYSTVHGAALSGTRAAGQIVNHNQMSKI